MQDDQNYSEILWKYNKSAKTGNGPILQGDDSMEMCF